MKIHADNVNLKVRNHDPAPCQVQRELMRMRMDQ
jgi:hypothetical protein